MLKPYYIGYLSPAVIAAKIIERNEGSPKMPIKDNSLMGISNLRFPALCHLGAYYFTEFVCDTQENRSRAAPLLKLSCVQIPARHPSCLGACLIVHLDTPAHCLGRGASVLAPDRESAGPTHTHPEPVTPTHTLPLKRHEAANDRQNGITQAALKGS